MKTVGIAIDSWKLGIFKRHLEAAGYEIFDKSMITPKTTLIRVKAPNVADLQPIVEAAQREARNS